MSLIMDAQKAAQREKDRRAGSAAPDSIPVLVPLKSKARSDFNWRRMLLFVGSGGAVLAAGWIVMQQTRDTIPRALSTLGPTPVSIAPPAAAGAATRDTTPAKELSRVANVDSAARTPSSATLRGSADRTPVRRPPVASRPPTSAPRATREDASGSAGGTPGQLRVAVEQPRAMEVARLFAAGVAAHRAGDVSTARGAYEQVLTLAPNDVDALNNLGVLLTALREFSRADVLLRRAVSLAPSSADAWSNLGTALRDRGRAPDAIAAFQHALAIDPRHPGARVSLAQQYFVIGSLAQARQLLVGVLADHPASPEASYALGQVLEKLGDKPGAVAAYTTFIRVAPAAYALYVEEVRRRVDALGARSP